MKRILDIIHRVFRAGERRSFITNRTAVVGAGLLIAGIINLLPLLLFFIAFMYVIANIMQIAIALLIAGVAIVLIRWALRGASKYVKKFRSSSGDDGFSLYSGDY